MSSINGLGGNLPVQSTTTVTPKVATETAAAARPSAADRLELSGVSHLFQALKTNDVRLDKIATIKSQIEAGTYETDDKVDGAADRLLDELGK